MPISAPVKAARSMARVVQQGLPGGEAEAEPSRRHQEQEYVGAPPTAGHDSLSAERYVMEAKFSRKPNRACPAIFSHMLCRETDKKPIHRSRAPGPSGRIAGDSAVASSKFLRPIILARISIRRHSHEQGPAGLCLRGGHDRRHPRLGTWVVPPQQAVWVPPAVESPTRCASETAAWPCGRSTCILTATAGLAGPTAAW